jgi:diacylglycerol kinase
MITPQKFFIKQARRFGFALSGLRYAIRTDKSFRLQWYGLGIVVSTILAILMPLTRDELLFIVGDIYPHPHHRASKFCTRIRP